MATTASEQAMEDIEDAVQLFFEGERTGDATLALICHVAGRYEMMKPPDAPDPEDAALYGFIDPQDEDRMYTSYDLAYLQQISGINQIFVKRANGVWVEHKPDDDVELYGLVGANNAHIHGSRSLVWIQDLQKQYPGSTVTVKHDGRWYDYNDARERG